MATQSPSTGENANATKQVEEEETTRRLVLQPSFLSKESYALFLIFLFALCYSLMGVFIKLAVATGLAPVELVLVRTTIQGIIVVGAMCYFFSAVDDDDTYTSNKGTKIRLIQQPFGQRNVRGIVFARGLIGGVGLMLYFYTMASIPLGDAATLLSLTPIITVVASSIFLDEPLTPSILIIALASVLGAALIAKPTFLFGKRDDYNDDNDDDDINRFGYITGLMGSCTASAVVILVRKAGTAGVHTLQLLFSWCLFGMLYAVFLCVYTAASTGNDSDNSGSGIELPSSPTAMLYVLLMSVFGTMGHFCMNYGGQYAPAGLTSIVRSSLIFWGFTFEVLIFGQIPDLFTLLGAILILSSLAVVAWKKYRKQEISKKMTEEDAQEEKKQYQLFDERPTTTNPNGRADHVSAGVMA